MLGTLLGAVVVILGCLIISIVVFGGAQIFIPYFKILLVNLLGILGLSINACFADNLHFSITVFSCSNGLT